MPYASEKARYTENEKLAILKTVDNSITIDDVRNVYGSSVEKFKLNQAIVWKYSRNYYESNPNYVLTGSTLKVYYALNKLAEKYYNIDRVFNLTASKEAVWNEEDKTYTWEVSIENTFALPYEKANNGKSTFVLTDNGNILKEGTDYTYDKTNNVFSISGTTEQATWSEANASGLIGKYTCKQATETGTCATLYLVESYYNTTSAYVIPLNSNSIVLIFSSPVTVKSKYFSSTRISAMISPIANIGKLLNIAT